MPPNREGHSGSPKPQMEYLSGEDRAFVRRAKQVLRETRHELDGICVLIPRMSLMSGRDANHLVEHCSSEVTDYILAVGHVISRILENNVASPEYRNVLTDYIHCFDWEDIVLPFSSMEAVIAAASRSESEQIDYPRPLVDVLTRFCLKLSIRTVLLMHRDGPLSWSETALIRDDASRLLNIGGFT